MDRVTVAEAAVRLRVKEQAVRKRIQRGTLAHDKDEDGRVYVYLDQEEVDNGIGVDTGIGTNTGTDTRTLVQSLQDQIEYLRAELQRRGETHAEESRRKDHIIAALTERIPELPSPATSQEHRDAPETASESADRVDVPPQPQEPPQRRSWLYRFFFGP
jgi:hypothetical protein